MNVKETAELTGIPADLLAKMRTRKTSTLQSGPPYTKKYNKNGVPRIIYNKHQVMRWMSKRNVLITAGEASRILGIERLEILAVKGVKRFDIHFGFIVVDTTKNLFLLVLKNKPRKKNAG